MVGNTSLDQLNYEQSFNNDPAQLEDGTVFDLHQDKFGSPGRVSVELARAFRFAEVQNQSTNIETPELSEIEWVLKAGQGIAWMRKDKLTVNTAPSPASSQRDYGLAS